MKHGNINNSLKEINFNNKAYFLKNFNQSDSFYRKKREIAFYAYSKKRRISNVPNFFIKNNFLFIEKVYPNNKHVNIEGYINYLLEFVKNLNLKYRDYAFYAKENLIQKSIFARVKDRISLIDEDKSVFTRKHYYKMLDHLNNFKFKAGNQIIINPSDVGMHNFLYTDKGPYFIDFEYSGKDKLIKLILDLVLHPANGIKSKDYIFFINKIYHSLTNDNQFINGSYISIFALWWSTRLECSISAKNIEKKIKLGLLSKKDKKKYINNRSKLIKNYENISKRYSFN